MSLTRPKVDRIGLNTDWDGYLKVLAAAEGNRLRITYDRGRLELVTPSFKHEWTKTTLGALVEALLQELEIDFIGGGSLSFQRQDLDRGLEPDECYRVARWEALKGAAPRSIASRSTGPWESPRSGVGCARTGCSSIDGARTEAITTCRRAPRFRADASRAAALPRASPRSEPYRVGSRVSGLGPAASQTGRFLAGHGTRPFSSSSGETDKHAAMHIRRVASTPGPPPRPAR